MTDDKRLIEDYLPIAAISAEGSREKSVRKGHVSTLHLWWARRPLVACRAAVYGALVPAARFVPNGASDEKKKSLGRANAAKFVQRLCRYPSDTKPAERTEVERAIREAQRHILEAHAERLTAETGKPLSPDDILEGRAGRPKVLDMFAGGGAISLEALRLACDAYALDLNPVAHLIELCTLVYPQKLGKPHPSHRGMTGPRGSNGETTWGGLAEEVRHWGNWVLDRVRTAIGDLYPVIPDPEAKRKKPVVQENWLTGDLAATAPAGYLMPVAYLWTRTVVCKNPRCAATVPLVKQTWLCKKKGRYVALKVVAPKGKKQVRFEVVEARSESGLGFDPMVGSSGGNATCPFCGTVADDEYVREVGCSRGIGLQLMAVAASRPKAKGKVYLAAADVDQWIPDPGEIKNRTQRLLEQSGIAKLEEPLNPARPSPNARGLSAVTRYGITTFGDLFTSRQMLCLLQFASVIRDAEATMRAGSYDNEQAAAVVTFLAAILDRLADFNSSLCVFNYTGGRGVVHTFGRHALPMVWDFAETNPFNPDGASWISGIEDLPAGLRDADMDRAAVVARGSATHLPWPDGSMDAVITDPPYYDNVPYADVSDFFYVWLRRVVGHLYPDHFASQLTPKKAEITALASRHAGDMSKANAEYEAMMAAALVEAHRVLKPDGQLSIVYAHKTTLGWATLIDALRKSGFVVTEAWPLDTEKSGRLLAQDASALASSIFLVARKRSGAALGSYEDRVRPELEQVVRERVNTLWELGISGADLLIACVGAGLRAFTRFGRVEYANGDEVPAERFLAEVETVVLETILGRLSKEVRSVDDGYSLTGLDGATRFYILWRYTYKAADLDAGEAIVFANGTHIELDGAGGLSHGARALASKNKSKYKLRNYLERGDDEKLGLRSEEGQPAPVIDTLHRTLWLMENTPGRLAEFLREAQPNRDQLRLVAHVLAGPALRGGEVPDVSPDAEVAALAKLTANWRSVVEDAALTSSERADKRTGQKRLMLSEDKQ